MRMWGNAHLQFLDHSYNMYFERSHPGASLMLIHQRLSANRRQIIVLYADL